MKRSHLKSRKSRKFSKEALDFVAGRFRVLGEPMRLKLLIALEAGEKNVTHLVQLAQTTQGNASKHLAVLRAAGIIDRRKEGLMTFYFISDRQILDLCDLMCSKLEREFAAKSSHFR